MSEVQVLPDYVEELEGNFYCFLKGSLSNADVTFKNQCSKCFVSDCTTVEEIFKRVASDWHAINALAFYKNEFAEETNPFVLSALRKKAKQCGLSLCLHPDTKVRVRITKKKST